MTPPIDPNLLAEIRARLELHELLGNEPWADIYRRMLATLAAGHASMHSLPMNENVDPREIMERAVQGDAEAATQFPEAAKRFLHATRGPRYGKREYVGGFEFACPSGCGTILHTSDGRSEQIEGGMRFMNIPCATCGTFYTVEATEEPSEDPFRDVTLSGTLSDVTIEGEPFADAKEETMGDKIEQALTKDEWEHALDPDVRESLAYEVTYLWGKTRPGAAIALANAALPDSDPRKITREIVEAIRKAYLEFGQTNETTDRILEIADALESYLPPE